MSVRVMLVDDQTLVRAGFRKLLEAEVGLEVVAEAADGVEALDLARQHRPDVVLMDIRMPRLDGIQATHRVLAELPDTRVVVLTTFDLDEYVFDALRAGASGFLLKDTPPDELIHALEVVSAGDALLSPSVTRRLIEEFATQPVPSHDSRVSRLTTRERDVLTLVAEGLSNAEVASRLYLGESTVKTHLSGVLSKLGLRDRVQAVVLAYETGLVLPGRTKGGL
jgi:DNA-binding NarL/FixJ family response regulator